MYISFRESCTRGFKKWSDAHLATGNENDAGDIPNGAVVSVRKSEIGNVLEALIKGSLPHGQVAGVDNPL
jgi:hypothetical protein